MCTEIYYFSGTGNSLFVARELARRIPDATLIPMVGLLGKKTIQTRGERVGLVFPVHASTLSTAVKVFVQKLDMRKSDYIFSIATRHGTEFHGFEKIDRLLKRKGGRLSARFIIDMYGNDPHRDTYKPPEEADILAFEKVALEKLDAMKDIVMAKAERPAENAPGAVKTAPRPIKSILIEKIAHGRKAVSEHVGGGNYFYCDDSCIGCGICEKVCLSKKITLRDRKPVWDKGTACYSCFACINFCPKESIQIRDIPGIKSYSRKNGRYSHPYATASVIAEQKKP
jgi:formate hydrogenlyase subunit 6/NADH:ubiquinone oxidoreductase subunit I